MNEKLIAPCGMNCGLCIAYQFKENDLNKRGFHKKYCPGCIPRGENCTHMKDACELLAKGSIRFCFECESFPCKRLKALDKRYRTKYHKVAIVYLHEKGCFEVWLSARNREISKVYEAVFSDSICDGFAVFHDHNNQDAIIECTLTSSPNFENQKLLIDIIEQGAERFVTDVSNLLEC